MRPIKFRAYLKREKIIIDVRRICWNEKGYIFGIDYSYKAKYVNHFVPFNPNNIILMQYTGCKDMNGKKIYDGDIVECFGRIRQIKWSWGRFYIYHPTEPNLDLEEAVTEFGLKVIGNIYENPELLEKK